MLKGRMLEILNYLQIERMASFKEIADALEIKERTVRYDIDCINDELSLKGEPLIEKYSKGMLFLPDTLDISKLDIENDFIYSPKERIAIVRLLLLLDTARFKISNLSKQLNVSRRTIQNDIEAVRTDLESQGLFITYNRKFEFTGETDSLYELRRKELENYFYLYEEETSNHFDIFIKKQLQIIYSPIEIEAILEWLDEISEEMHWIFSDESYHWYVSNVLAFTWYIKNHMEVPGKMLHAGGEIQERIDQYEEIIGQKLSEREKEILSSFTKYTKRYENLDINLELVETEDLVLYLVQKMSEKFNVDFSKDGILLKGLLNHVGPMLERLKGNIQFDEESEFLIPKQYYNIRKIMEQVLNEHEVLRDLTQNERVYLTVYFIGSLKRINQTQYKKALLICGFGYGTTAIIKDALINEYQIDVKDCIPAYRVCKYDHWDDIDVVISTVDVKLPVEKPYTRVNVIFESEDRIKLDGLGIQHKEILNNFFAIERRLDFLNLPDKERVMSIIKEELGYSEVRMPTKYYKLTDLLKSNSIKIVDHVDDWREAINLCTNILVESGKITPLYCQNIIKGIQVQGFYSVTDGSFALLHGNETKGVNVSCMSLLISKEPVKFGDKQVNIIFCLASKDKKEHVPAIIRLVRMVNRTNFIEDLSHSTDQKTAMEVIMKYQTEVEKCYP